MNLICVVTAVLLTGLLARYTSAWPPGLRGRAWSKRLGRGLSLAGSSLRRNVCELLFGMTGGLLAL